MRKIVFICSAIVLFAASAYAQKEKPWTDWTDKDVQKMLTDSAWAQTQKELSDASGPSGPTITSAAQNGNSANMVMSDKDKSSSESGETMGRKNQTLTVNYSVSFLSAKPVRQAFIRFIEMKNPDTPKEKVEERRKFIDGDFSQYIVVSLRLDGNDRKKIGPALQLLTSSKPEDLKSTTYLERKDGKRVEMIDYRAPGPDGMGAKFVFPRMVEGKPFLDGNSGEIRVYIEVGKTKLTRRFKVADMMYDGKLEY